MHVGCRPFELSLAEVPDPTNPDIKVREVPAKTVAVVQFSGWYSDSKGESYARELTRALVDDKLITPEQVSLCWRMACRRWRLARERERAPNRHGDGPVTACVLG